LHRGWALAEAPWPLQGNFDGELACRTLVRSPALAQCKEITDPVDRFFQLDLSAVKDRCRIILFKACRSNAQLKRRTKTT